MVADASIYGMLRPPQAGPGPLEQYGQALQLKNLMTQNTMGERALASDEAVRGAFNNMQPGQTIKDLLPQIYKADPKTGMALQAKLLEQEKAQGEIDKNRLEAHGMQIKQLRDQTAAVSSDADLAALRENATKLYGPQVVANMPQSVSDPNFAQWQQKNVMDANALLERTKPNYTVANLGGTSRVIQTNPNAPGAVTGDMQHTPTIGDKISLAHLGVQAASADPFGTLGIRGIAQKAGAPMGGSVMAGGGGGATPAGAAAVSNAQTGDAYLQTLPKNMADQVKALAEGRMQFPGGFALKSPYWQQMLQSVSQYDPNFDAVNYNARSGVRKAFTSGAESKSLNALNTVMGHLDEFEKAGTALNNTDFPMVNMALNTLGGAVSPDLKARLNQFNITKQAVVSEMERAYRGTGGSQADIESWKKTLNDADSPEAIRASIQQGVKLLGSKIEALGDQYNKGMGTTKTGLQLLNPKAQATYNRLVGEGASTGAAPSAGAPAFTRAEIEAELRRRKVTK